MHLAAYSGRIKCLEYLHSQGGDVTKKNHNRQTPAMLAALTGRTEVLEWLLNITKNLTDTPEHSLAEVNSMGYLLLVRLRCFSDNVGKYVECEQSIFSTLESNEKRTV